MIYDSIKIKRYRENQKVWRKIKRYRGKIKKCKEKSDCIKESVYIDDGWSGRSFERPAVMEMLKQVKNGRIQCIIVKDLSRFGRNYLEVGNYITRVFPFLDVRFIAINDGFDSIRPMEADSLEVHFKTLLYDLYSRDLSHKVKNALRFKAGQGKYVAAFAPYGYVKDPEDKSRIVPDPAAAENVRCIFRMAADGMSTMQIARTMNERLVLTPMQYKRKNGCSRAAWNCVCEDNFWTPETVIKILRDERYTGKAVFGKQKRTEVGSVHQMKVNKADWITVENAHEAIISQEEFDYAQSKLRAYMERGTVCKSRNLLKRKVRCGICGRAMMRAGSRQNPYYTCLTSFMTDEYSCPAKRIPEAVLLEAVQKNIREQAKYTVDFCRIREEQQRQKSRDADALRKTLSKLKESYDGLESYIQKLYEKYAFGELDKKEYLELKRAALEKCGNISGQMKGLEAALKNTGANEEPKNKCESKTCRNVSAGKGHEYEYGSQTSRNVSAGEGHRHKFEEGFNWYTQIEELTDSVTADVLQEVIVYPGSVLHIVWNCQDVLKNLFLDMETTC